MFKCCISGAKEDEEAKEKVKGDKKQSSPLSRETPAETDGVVRSGGVMTNTSASIDDGRPPPPPTSNPTGGGAVLPGAKLFIQIRAFILNDHQIPND